MKGKVTQNSKAVQETKGDSRSWKLGKMEHTENGENKQQHNGE